MLKVCPWLFSFVFNVSPPPPPSPCPCPLAGLQKGLLQSREVVVGTHTPRGAQACQLSSPTSGASRKASSILPAPLLHHYHHHRHTPESTEHTYHTHTLKNIQGHTYLQLPQTIYTRTYTFCASVCMHLHTCTHPLHDMETHPLTH